MSTCFAQNGLFLHLLIGSKVNQITIQTYHSPGSLGSTHFRHRSFPHFAVWPWLLWLQTCGIRRGWSGWLQPTWDQCRLKPNKKPGNVADKTWQNHIKLTWGSICKRGTKKLEIKNVTASGHGCHPVLGGQRILKFHIYIYMRTKTLTFQVVSLVNPWLFCWHDDSAPENCFARSSSSSAAMTRPVICSISLRQGTSTKSRSSGLSLFAAKTWLG